MRFVPFVTLSGGQAGFKMLNGQDGEKPQGKECRRKQMLLDMVCTGPHLAWPGTQVQGQGGMALPGLWAWEDPYGLGSHTPSLLWPRGEGLRGRCGSPEPELGAVGRSTGKGKQGAVDQGPGRPSGLCPEPPADTGMLSIWHSTATFISRRKNVGLSKRGHPDGQVGQEHVLPRHCLGTGQRCFSRA